MAMRKDEPSSNDANVRQLSVANDRTNLAAGYQRSSEDEMRACYRDAMQEERGACGATQCKHCPFQVLKMGRKNIPSKSSNPPISELRGLAKIMEGRASCRVSSYWLQFPEAAQPVGNGYGLRAGRFPSLGHVVRKGCPV
jgi:hypothetical protein